MRKSFLLALVLAILLPAVAQATGAYKITAVMEIGFGPEFLEMIKSQMGEGAEGMTAEDLAAMMPESMGMVATIYTAENKMRMEMASELDTAPVKIYDPDTNTSSIQYPTVVPLTSIMIYDYDSSVSYMLDPAGKTAMKMDLSSYKDASAAMGLPNMSPEEIASNIDAYIDAIKGIEGFDVQELGQKEILGRSCRGISFTGDLAKIMSAMNTEASADTPAMPAMNGTYTGTIWVANDLSMPMEMQMELSGMTMKWTTNAVEDWQADPSMFQVPADYQITDMSELAAPEVPAEASSAS